ncbi:acetyl-CoA carboxylase biotin carboxylase subunit family protein [Amycolatopsis sp. 195334CR]|uniref:ATP-grasp domain-containing protein n=1 Tax=Amycolatopsis sp. 195334CR TaxID=2814588 RepID=UPI001A8C7CA7|nr:ATP-grasp domain-containing protein [Amycolatopsis sp. 195334CR]MBN6039539.1 ATP-grasp domain-containing protein [Amycolatopsis sp. 195334CR]
MVMDVFVVGLDEENERTLHRIPGADELRFHGLLTIEDIQHGEIPIEELLEKAQRELDAFDGEIGAIIGYWDFPVSTMVPLLCRRYGLPSAPLEAIVKCEHKYWSRLEQAKVIDEFPEFDIVDLAGQPEKPEKIDYPLWLKPVKSFSSELAFKVTDDETFDEAVREIRDGISRVGKPFQFVMDQLRLPPEIADIGGEACLAESALSGVQAAVEGYAYNGDVVVYGALDSINYEGTTSFLRHQYPSQLPDEAQTRMSEIAQRVIKQMGLDHGTFSVEFFVHPESNQVCLLEINPRHSQSHAELFEDVDGVPNHYRVVQLGLGRDPSTPARRGKWGISAKWYHRRFEDGVVERVPTAEEIAEIEQRIPGVQIELVVEEGQRLSDLPAQDSYSFELADVVIGAASEKEMAEKFDRVVEALDFRFSA